MSRHVFINYRRALSLKDAQLLHARLQRQFGQAGVFLDVSGLDGGDHWLHTLERHLNASVAMVALIAPGWANAINEQGDRRLDNPNDFVRFELARAFARPIPVLPVLVDGAEMPDVAELPSNLLPLSFPQAMLLRSASFEDDAEKIGKRLKVLIAQARPRGVSLRAASAASMLALATGVAAPIGAAHFGFLVPGLAVVSSDPVLVARVERAEAAVESEKAAKAKLIEDAQASEERQKQALAAARTTADQRVAAVEAALNMAAEEAKRAASARDAARREVTNARERLASAESELKSALQAAAKFDAEARTSKLDLALSTTKFTSQIAALAVERDEAREHAKMAEQRLHAAEQATGESKQNASTIRPSPGTKPNFILRKE